MIDKRKVILIGTGFVGMSMAYSLENQGGINELVLIDVLEEKAAGEAMDLVDGILSAPTNLEITAGQYADCKDADIVVITAGLAQKPGQTRLELAIENTKIMIDITKKVIASRFQGIFIVATNPVDLMSYVVQYISQFPPEKVIGSGTILDTTRLRYAIGKFLNVSPRNIHTYIIGEHGDSSFVPWSCSYVGCKPLIEVMKERNETMKTLEEIFISVQQKAYEIINRKKATYYGIGMELARLVKSIFQNERGILTVSTLVDHYYGHYGLYLGLPSVISNQGISHVLNLQLTEEEQAKLDKSFSVLSHMKDQINKILL